MIYYYEKEYLMNPKMEKTLNSFDEDFKLVIDKIEEEHGFIENLDDKIYFLIAKKLDFTFLQIKEERETCNMKELKKANAFLVEALNDIEKFKKGLELIQNFNIDSYYIEKNKEISNAEQQSLSSHFCLIAQNLTTKKYARFIFEEADEVYEEGYSLEFTELRSKATEITKISESTKSIDYIQKLLTIDFPEVNWKVFKSARIKGRDVTPYPVH